MKSITSVVLAMACLMLTSGELAAQATTTTVELLSSANPSLVGQQVTFRALITGPNPFGTVQFADGSVNLSTPVTVSCVTSPCILTAAFFQTSALTQGVHSISATFNGDGASGSGTLAQVVNGPASAPALSAWLATLLAVLVGGIGMAFMRRSRG